MSFIKISPKPGVFTDGTRYSAEGTWYDTDKVRFRKGFAEKLGVAWVTFTISPMARSKAVASALSDISRLVLDLRNIISAISCA